jgi:hypothetical protein
MRIGPDNPIKFIGLLGFSNHRKSTLLFTFAFNAAMAGHKVMVVPRECSVEDVWMRFCWLYAAQKGLADQLPDIDKALDNNYARREHRDLIRSLKQQMTEDGFNVDVVSTGEWQTIRGRLENYVDRPYDMLCVDYMAHLNTPGVSGSHQRDAIVGIFHDAQALSQDYNEGRGLAVVTPLQANKAGEAEVRKPDAVLERGIYRDLGAVDWYTDAGRDMDAVIGIWSGDGLQEHNLAVISCVKSRSRFFRPFYMCIDPKTQMMSEVSDRQAGHIVAGGQIAAPSVEHKEQQQLSDFITSMEEVAY